jgi:uncharacterized coiled-coil protein SlyX
MTNRTKTPTNEAKPAVTFSPDALAALLNEVTESRKVMAQMQAQMQAMQAKPEPAPKASMAGKTDKQVANEIAVVKAFKKAGFGVVKPKLTEYQIDEAKRRLEAGESQSEVGRLFGVSHQTIGRL